MNKLLLAIHNNELQLAVLLLPVAKLSYYLTDRVSNYEELEPYFPLVKNYPFMIIGFDTEDYNSSVPFLPKGKDGMSTIYNPTPALSALNASTLFASSSIAGSKSA